MKFNGNTTKTEIDEWVKKYPEYAFIFMNSIAESLGDEDSKGRLIIDNYKLPIEVTIGNCTFKKNVPVKLVLDRLQRQFKYNREEHKPSSDDKALDIPDFLKGKT